MIRKVLRSISSLLLLFCLPASLWAITYPLPDANTDLVGQLGMYKTEAMQTITDIALSQDIGYNRFQAANPWYPFNDLSANKELIVPSFYLLPNTPHTGIVVNVAELMLYYYPPRSNTVQVFPLGIGKEGDWQTPIMVTKVTSKEANPVWYPPETVREDFLKKVGYPLPKFFPPGGINPLGAYAIHLQVPGYLIHGTNDPAGIGQRVTAGCMHLYPHDIATLYQEVYRGLRVQVVYQTVLVAFAQNRLYMEVIPPLPDKGYPAMPDYHPIISAAIKAYEKAHPNQQVFVNWQYASDVYALRLGVPDVIGWTEPASPKAKAVVAPAPSQKHAAKQHQHPSKPPVLKHEKHTKKHSTH